MRRWKLYYLLVFVLFVFFFLKHMPHQLKIWDALITACRANGLVEHITTNYMPEPLFPL